MELLIYDHDKRFIGQINTNSNATILLLNVYLPYQSDDNVYLLYQSDDNADTLFQVASCVSLLIPFSDVHG